MRAAVREQSTATLQGYGLGEDDDYGMWRRGGRLLIFEPDGRFTSTDEQRCQRLSGHYEAYRSAVLLIPEEGPWELLERGADGIFNTVLTAPTDPLDLQPRP